MNLLKTMNINLFPCMTEHQLRLIQLAIKEGRFNEKLYERIKIEREKNKVEGIKEYGVRFIFNKTTQTLQAYPVGIERSYSIRKRSQRD